MAIDAEKIIEGSYTHGCYDSLAMTRSLASAINAELEKLERKLAEHDHEYCDVCRKPANEMPEIQSEDTIAADLLDGKYIVTHVDGDKAWCEPGKGYWRKDNITHIWRGETPEGHLKLLWTKKKGVVR